LLARCSARALLDGGATASVATPVLDAVECGDVEHGVEPAVLSDVVCVVWSDESTARRAVELLRAVDFVKVVGAATSDEKQCALLDVLLADGDDGMDRVEAVVRQVRARANLLAV